MIAHRPGAAPSRLYASTTATFDGDLDYIAIEYAMNGEEVTVTLAEKLVAARLLDARGYNPTDIGRLIHSDRSTILGWKNNGWTLPTATQLKQQPPTCGDKRMYDLHIRRGETPCDPCKRAAAADRVRRRDGAGKRTPPVCGEARMYRKHLARGETPCDDCRAANAAADRRYRLTGSRKGAA